MKNVCLYFQVHQPFRLKQYRFFEIGNDHYYFDDYSNKRIMRKIAARSYLPSNELFLKLAKKFGDKFKVAFSISGIALDQFELYAPEVIESFKKLAKTGRVEFLSETYSHSLVALKSKDEFRNQVQKHSDKIERLFGQKPKVFRNTELVYDDGIGEMVSQMGYKGMLAEGAKHILGWKSPNFLYYNVAKPELKLMLRNFKLSDDIAFRFSNNAWNEWPLTAEKYVKWLTSISDEEDVVNLFMDYETFGEHQSAETGIYKFLEDFFVRLITKTEIELRTPSEIVNDFLPVAPLPVPYPTSWADEERDVSAWLGNELQKEAFNKLYALRDDVLASKSPELIKDWDYLQASDHFYYMCTKFFSDQAVHNYFNPYKSPYEAFINYMNVLSDFILRLEASLDREKYKGVAVEELEPEILNEAIERYSAVLRKLRKKKKENDKQTSNPFDSKR
jgi:alpha-amylase